MLREQLKKDMKEVINQIGILQKSLVQMTEQFSKDFKANNEYLNENKQYLVRNLKPKIDKLLQKMNDYLHKVNEKMDSQFIESDIQTQYQDFDKSMQEFYVHYKLIWAQVFYFSQRKRIIMNEDSALKEQLINNLLQ